MTEEDIIKICDFYYIENYSINDDMSIDVDGNVELREDNFGHLPLNFNKVTGDFRCIESGLSTLNGCPKYVGKNFIVNDNKLSSLMFSPRYVGDGFYCGGNKLTNLDYLPENIGGDFYVSHNILTSLKGSPQHINGKFDCDQNELTSLEYCPTYVERAFFCSNNLLSSLNELPMNFYVGGSFLCDSNYFTEAKEYSRIFFGTINGKIVTGKDVLNDFFNINKNPPKKDLPRLLSELRKITL